MVDNTARKSIPGRDANLPPFIVERMLELDMRPTLTQLAIGAGISKTSLGENLAGKSGMKLDTALRMADFLQCDLTELVKNAGLC